MTLPKIAAALLLLLVSCNPAPRCKSAADCPSQAYCSGGFCADGPVSEREGAVDFDGPDSGTAEPVTQPDGGVLDDGR